MVEDEHHHRALEPAVSEGQRFRASLLQPDTRRNLAPRDVEHLGRRIDAPHAGGGVPGEPRGERAGAAADVEYPPATQVAGLGEQPVHLGAKRRLCVAKLVVVRRELAEVRATAQRSDRPAR
jgi:hypothetical protein